MFELSKIINVSDITSLTTPKAAMNELISINNQSAYYGLSLTEKDVKELVWSRNAVLKSSERIEFGFDTLECIINAFYKSPYINQFEYADIIGELQELFYLIKNEVDEVFSDEELIRLMAELFDRYLGGSIEYLRGKGVEIILDMAKNRKEEQSEEGETWI